MAASLRSPVRDVVLRPVRSVLTWPVASQQRARRNALVASTALAQRRLERLEVEAFLASYGAAPAPAPAPAVAAAL